jgi:serine/threonine protein kinase
MPHDDAGMGGMVGSEPREGAIVGDRFCLERMLGEGGMGEVWAATDVQTGAHRALKFLKSAGSDDERRRRFLREARAAMTIDSPHVVRIHSVEDREDLRPFMVMDLLEGETMRAHLDRVGRLSLQDALALVMPIISAVGAAHANGIVHRDLKPENVFLSPEGGTLHVRVLDFGVAKFAASSTTPALTESGDRLGTPRYMAPEQARGSRDVDHRVDVWALGIMLWEALAGRHPIAGDNVGSIYKAITLDVMPELRDAAPDVPADVAALISRMLSRDPDGRPHDLREVAAVLGKHYGCATPVIAPASMELTAVDERRSMPTIDDTIDGTTVPSREKRVGPLLLLLVVVIVALAGVTIAAVRRGASSAPPQSTSR